MLGLIVLWIRVIFHLGQDVWCIVRFFFPSLDLGHVSIMMVIISTSGSCTQPPGDLPVDFLLLG